MKNLSKKIGIFLIIGILVIILIIFLSKVFSFQDNKEENLNEITEELISKLYSYIPQSIYFDTVYSGNYTNKNILNNSAIELMAYNYLEENKLFNDKVKREDFQKALFEVFGENIAYKPKDIQISPTTSLVFENDTFTKSNKEIIKNNDYVIFNDKTIYTVMANKNIIITDYYLKCNKLTKVCYNDEKESEINNYYKYSDDLESSLNKDNLRKYNHTFIYKDGKYYWEKTEKA